jgi:hypothetical protein
MNKPLLLGVMCLSFECPEPIQPPCEQECSQESLMAGSTPLFPMPLFLLPGYGGTDSLPVPRFELPPIRPIPPIPPFQPPIHPPIDPPLEPKIPQQPVPEPSTFATATVLGLIGLIYSRRNRHA